MPNSRLVFSDASCDFQNISGIRNGAHIRNIEVVAPFRSVVLVVVLRVFAWHAAGARYLLTG